MARAGDAVPARARRAARAGGAARARLLAELRQRPDEVADLLHQLKGRVIELSSTAAGCRQVQDALRLAQKRDQKLIVRELRGHVCELLDSPHGNHVLQLAVELLPPEAVEFICSEILDRWDPVVLARHPYGCRILERLIEHFPARALAGAVGDILGKVESLSDDHYGNYVIQHLLEHGTEGDRKQIGKAVRSNVARFAGSAFACGVLDKALTYGSWGDQLDIARRVLEQEPLLVMLATSAHGFASTQRLFQVAANARGSAAHGAAAEGGLLELACRQLLKQSSLDAILACKHGQSLLKEVLPGGHHSSAGAPPQAQPRTMRVRERRPAE